MYGFLRSMVVAGVLAGMTLSASAAPSSGSGSKSGGESVHVYLLRGLLNIFSLGLDDLAEKLQRRGIAATVGNHADWEVLAGEIVARRRAGWKGSIVLVGHSLGADVVYPLAEELGKHGVSVSLIVSFDPVNHQYVTRNVSKAVNFYLSGGGLAVARGPGFSGELINRDLEGRDDLTHTSIEKSARLHADVISRVLSLSGSSKPKPKDTSATTAPADATGATPSAASTASAPAASAPSTPSAASTSSTPAAAPASAPAAQAN